MSETVKVYLNGNEEIRKFNWDFKAGFKNLERKIYEVFTLPEGKKLQIRWKDEENEYINVSTDAELQLMLVQLSKTPELPKKLYVLHCQEPGEGDYIHRGVECDNCRALNLCGSRYKCLECRDFDLCESCFRRGEHRHHDMMVLRSAFGVGRYIASRSLRRYLGASSSNGACSGVPSSRLSAVGGGPLKRAATEGPPECGDMTPFTSFTSRVNDETTMAHSDLGQRSSKDICQDMDSFTRRSAGIAFAPNDYDSMGRFIAEVLSERGLQCSISVENSPHNTNVSVDERLPTSQVADPVTQSQVRGLQQQMETCSLNSDGYSMLDASELPSMTSFPPSNNRTPTASPFPLSNSQPMLTPTPPTASSTNPFSQPSRSSIPAPQQFNSRTSTQSQRVHNPPLPPMISERREQMLNMGFTDENGWLTDLLVLHNGDISKCLDDIQNRTSGP